jgi:hypothetical protein
MMVQEPDLIVAIRHLRPAAEFICYGEAVYDNIEWLDQNQTKPTQAEIEAKIAELRGLAGENEP